MKGLSSKKLIIKSEENDGNMIDVLCVSTKKFINLILALENLKKTSKENKLKIYSGNDEFEIIPIHNSDNIKLNGNLKSKFEKYSSLSRKELTILCFLYRGYQQAQIAMSLGISINTYRQHRKQLYRKMEFSTKYDLHNWCDNYLNYFFKQVAYFFFLILMNIE